MNPLLAIAEILVSIGLIAAVLLQSRGAGLGATFGGESSAYRSRRGVEKTLFQFTIIMAALFVTVCLVSFLTAARRQLTPSGSRRADADGQRPAGCADRPEGPFAAARAIIAARSGVTDPNRSPRRGGGIGRRARFRTWWPQGRVGSSPSLGTIPHR